MEETTLSAALFAPATRFDYTYAPGDIGAPDHVPAGLSVEDWNALIAARESGAAPIPTVDRRPFIDRNPESIAPTSGTQSAPDPFTARTHTVGVDGRVIRRGRAAVVGSVGRFDRHGRLIRWVTHDGRTIDHRSIDAHRYLMADLETRGLDVDANGRTQSLQLARIAERVYGVESLVGTDAISWESIIDGGARELDPRVVHMNPRDPFDAVHTGRLHPLRHSPNVDVSLWESMVELGRFDPVYRPTVTRFPTRIRLPKGRARRSDPIGSDIELAAPHSDTGRFMWIGHRRVDRGQTVKAARKTARIARVATETVALPSTVDGLTTLIANMPRESGLTIDGPTHRIRASRDRTGRWSIRVTHTDPIDGRTVARSRSNIRTSASTVAAIRNLTRA